MNWIIFLIVFFSFFSYNLQSALAKKYNTKYFNPRSGENITQDFAAILSSIDSGTIIFSKGTYYIDSVIIKKSNITIDGRGARLIFSKGSSSKAFNVYGSNITLKNFIVENKKKNRFIDGVVVYNSDKINLNRILLSGFSGKGIDVLFSKNITISNSEVRGGVHGIQVWGGEAKEKANIWMCENIQISNNKVLDVDGGGIWLSRARNVNIFQNVVDDCGDVGIDFEQCSYASAENNRVLNCKNGGITFFFGGDNISVAKNDIIQTMYSGPSIKFYSWISAAENVFISENNFIGDSEYFIELEPRSVKNSRFSKNRLKGSCKYGIYGIEADSMIIDSNMFDFDKCLIGLFNVGGSCWQIARNTLKCKQVFAPESKSVGMSFYWRSKDFPCQANYVRDNAIKNFSFSIVDDSWGDHYKKKNVYEKNILNNIYSNYKNLLLLDNRRNMKKGPSDIVLNGTGYFNQL